MHCLFNSHKTLKDYLSRSKNNSALKIEVVDIKKTNLNYLLIYQKLLPFLWNRLCILVRNFVLYIIWIVIKVCNISKFRKEKQEQSTNRHVFLMWKSPLRINGQTVGITILIFAVIQPNPFLNDILFQLFFVVASNNNH